MYRWITILLPTMCRIIDRCVPFHIIKDKVDFNCFAIFCMVYLWSASCYRQMSNVIFLFSAIFLVNLFFFVVHTVSTFDRFWQIYSPRTAFYMTMTRQQISTWVLQAYYADHLFLSAYVYAKPWLGHQQHHIMNESEHLAIPFELQLLAYIWCSFFFHIYIIITVSSFMLTYV